MSQRIHEILDQQVAKRPDACAATDSLGTKWSFTDLHNASLKLADELGSLGIQPTDRVLLLLENCALVMAAMFAISRIGAVSVPFNARQTAGELDRVIDHAKPVALLFTSAVSPDAAAHAVRLGAQPATSLPGLDVISKTSAPDDVLDDVSTILYTTGTTGAPKGVMLKHANLVFAGKTSSAVRQMNAADTIYGVLPISHVYGLSSLFIAAVTVGATIWLEPRFVPAKLHEALKAGITVLPAVPQMHALLMQHIREQGYEQLGSETLRYVSSGAAPLDPDWKRRAEAFYGVPLQNGYGMTETTAAISLTRHTVSNDDISVGTPLSGVTIKLDRNAPKAENDVGEILVGGGGIMKGYYRDAELTNEVLTADGWFRTGDLGRHDAEGNLHIVGRSKELIIHGGFNVYPPEVEAAFNDHPQVVQCAVVGHVVDGDEQVYAFVEATRNDWPDEEELRNFAAERLTGYKRPSKIFLVEKLPAAATGKILKHKLNELIG